MNLAESFLEKRLKERVDNGTLRKLSSTQLPFDFCSNDYLGFANSSLFKEMIAEETIKCRIYKNGSGGSRLLAGNYPYTEETEKFIANFHNAENGLIFNSGYDANVGLLSSIPQRGDTIITDELIHASLIDGARLSHAERFRFKHNDLADLEAKIKNAKGIIYVVIESIYSMDGDTAPLLEISKLCKLYQANLIVDEAHATGVFGKKGKGLVSELNLQESVFARIVTFGKALGTHGAIVLGSNTLRDYLINFARSFIYTTAAPIHNIISVNCAYQLIDQGNFDDQIRNKIALYNELIKTVRLSTIKSDSAIQTILFTNSLAAKDASNQLQKKGFDVKAILSPTVAEGKERLRICLHTYNTDQEITDFVNELHTL